jgi:hypothetical protein
MLSAYERRVMVKFSSTPEAGPLSGASKDCCELCYLSLPAPVAFMTLPVMVLIDPEAQFVEDSVAMVDQTIAVSTVLAIVKGCDAADGLTM